MLHSDFASSVKSLHVPEMGTESVAPLLYWLLRTTRPQCVLEVGMGYTTPFLAKALIDNKEAIRQERELLGTPEGSECQPLAYGDYYNEPYEPKLICLDRMTDPASSATRALGVMEDLDLTSCCEVIEGDLRGSSGRVRETAGSIDFAWIDTWNTLAFIREYWDLIDSAGGMLAIHYLMTYPEGRAVLRYLESLRSREGGRLEITNLREPHRVAQNSVTLLRRTRNYEDPDDLRPNGDRNDPTGALDVQ
ncbi:hypothetical protein ACFWPV_15630 [Streptomyces uncialis]|uniref:hypothetical protein n=1 Tax=Streptomyces uncialis TaxID=1048205 RepID=UPI00364EBE65